MRKVIWVLSVLLLLACEEVEIESLYISDSQPLTGDTSLFESEELVCNYPEVMPLFPGGNLAMINFIADNIRIPEECIEGRVFVSFIVETDGSLTNIEVVKGLTQSINMEAVRVIKLFPDFQPGKIYDEPVRMRMIIPVKF